jgi:hypothetical protein
MTNVRVTQRTGGHPSAHPVAAIGVEVEMAT